MDTVCPALTDLNLNPDLSQDGDSVSDLDDQTKVEDYGGFADLSELPIEVSDKRPTCMRCCSATTSVHLSLYCPASSRGKSSATDCSSTCSLPASRKIYPELATVCKDQRTLILYPGSGAQNLEELDQNFSESEHNVIIIDGTWSQAKDMFLRNSLFRLPKQVQLQSAPSSQYVIRTQPTNMCLSTLECAAVTLSIMEKDHNIQEVLLRPLQALCSFQLQHGAQIHHSKEHLLRTGAYDRPMPKNKRKIKRMQRLLTNQNI
ncbi:DTW domain-containing protein 2 isoform X2 [Chanos chanos]|uniref:tRNA-uridine aminocarboxypropyltransferase n=1 Tax=Chanos chanos TaxID=29144 RepID=A0A6J2UZU2_CHACN|nr:DTW domain-containing protein 2 isoform X2 [Chanos chanos]